MIRAATIVLLGLCACAHRSIADAVESHDDEFPPPFGAVVPPSQTSTLGRQWAASDAKGGRPRYTLSADRCFFVTAPTTKESLNRLTVRYRSKVDIGAELKAVAAGAGADIATETTAFLELVELTDEETTFVPNPNGCDFIDGQEFEVFARQIRARKATLKFRRDVGIKGTASVPVPSGPVTVQPSAGWKGTNERTLEGSDIVLAAQPSRWRMRVTAHEENLGPTVGTPRSVTVPGVDGALTVLACDATERRLPIRADVPAGVAALPPAGYDICTFGEKQTMGVGELCFFWPYPGNTAYSVRWELKESARIPERFDVIVHTKTYLARPAQ